MVPRSSYAYSLSFVGDPKLWSGSESPDAALQRAAREHEVAFPASKALLWDFELAYVL